MCVYIYTSSIHICTHTDTHIYIYKYTHVCVNVCYMYPVFVYAHIHIDNLIYLWFKVPMPYQSVDQHGHLPSAA